MPTAWLSTGAFRGPHGEVTATYEHPLLIRFAHWLGGVAIVVMAGSGLQILRAFPAFGAKVPQHDLVTVPRALALGGWLAGGLQWHFTFMWIFMGAAATYVCVQALTGRFRMVLFGPRDIPGVWPMARHYFLSGPKPLMTEPYNPLQKLAYTATLLFAAISLLSGLVLYKPAQFSALALVLGGYRAARIWHFAAMCGLLGFIPGHLLMVALHGWDNFAGMLTGWKRNPEYLAAGAGARAVSLEGDEGDEPAPVVGGSTPAVAADAPPHPSPPAVPAQGNTASDRSRDGGESDG